MSVPKWVTPVFVVELVIAVATIVVRHRARRRRLRS
jgi:hypothetical protein